MDNRILSISDLRDLLNDGLVIECVQWEEVGLELGIEQHVLEEIALDYSTTRERKRKMLIVWLQNMEATKEKLHNAIKKVHERQNLLWDGKTWTEKKSSITEEKKRAVDAVNVLEHLLDQWDTRNKQIDSERQKLEKRRQNEERWIGDIKARLEKEESNSEKRELHKTIERTEKALERQHNYAGDRFVQQFLRHKGFNDQQIPQIKDELVQGMLRQHLLEKQITLLRNSTIVADREEMEEHFKKCKDLMTKVSELSMLLDERSIAYEKIQEGLKKLGVKSERLDDWKQQSEAFKRMTEEWSTNEEKFKKLQREVRTSVDQWKENLRVFIESLNCNVQQMAANQTKYIEELPLLVEVLMVTAGSVGGGVGGFIVGAAAGTAVLPVVGTAIGAFGGLYGGALTGRYIGGQMGRAIANVLGKPVDDDRSKELRKALETEYTATLDKGRNMQKMVNNIYRNLS